MSGRPYKKLDWDEIDKLLQAGCLSTEIAGRFGVCRDTLYKRCIEDNKIDYSTYSQQKKSNGEALLRAKQYSEAMKGDKSMLIWLGKNRLGQSDKKDVNVNANLSDFESWTKMQENESETT